MSADANVSAEPLEEKDNDGIVDVEEVSELKGIDETHHDEDSKSKESKKGRSRELSNQELSDAVMSVLQTADLQTTTFRSVRLAVEQRLGTSLRPYKAQTKALVDDFLNRQAETLAAMQQEHANDVDDNRSDDDDDKPQNKSVQKSQKSVKETRAKRKRKQTDQEDDSGSRQRPARSLPAYFLYAQEHRLAVKEEFPEASFSELGKILGERWRELDAEAKQPFIEKAQKGKEQYKHELAEWKQTQEAVEQKKRIKSQDHSSPPSSDDEGEGNSKKELSFFDQVVDRLKTKRRRRDEDVPIDVIETMIPDLLERMKQAVIDDIALFEAQRPAIHKLRMLEEVVYQCTKRRFHEYLLDRGILRRFRDWLEPLPDGSLPNATIRMKIYSLLDTVSDESNVFHRLKPLNADSAQMPIDQDYLVESEGLGKVLMSLHQSAYETVTNKRLLRSMIERWSRPMLGVETDYRRLKDIEEAKHDEIQDRARALHRTRHRSNIEFHTRHAKRPDRATFDYAIRPVPDLDRIAQQQQQIQKRSRGGDDDRERRITKRMDSLSRSSSGKQRAVNVKLNRLV